MDIQEISDTLEIGKLRHAWSWTYDEPDYEGLISLFTYDAVCEYGPYGTWDGIEQIREGFAKVVAMPGTGGLEFATFHAVSNGSINVNGDTATGRFYLLDFVLDTKASGNPLKMLGVYDDEYRREEGTWKISGIKLTFYWASHVGPTGGKLTSQLDWNAQGSGSK
jgi:ketosteroid isomerase-like protein